MSAKDLDRRPHPFKKKGGIDTRLWWWYEMPQGIEVYHEVRAHGGGYIRTDNYTIPWRAVRGALKRLDK